jgi:hypothetical protein
MKIQYYPVPLRPGERKMCDLCFEFVEGEEGVEMNIYIALSDDWWIECEKCLHQDAMCSIIKTACVDCKTNEER